MSARPRFSKPYIYRKAYIYPKGIYTYTERPCGKHRLRLVTLAVTLPPTTMVINCRALSTCFSRAARMAVPLLQPGSRADQLLFTSVRS